MRPDRAMTDSASVRTAGDHRARVLSIGAGTASVAFIVGVTLALHFVWLWRFRHGYLTEGDESGYMQFALSDFDALHDQGLVTFAKIVGGRGTFGPLLPAVTALAYPIVGRGVFGSLLVVPIFFVALVLATYGIARRLVSVPWAVVSALAVAAIPAVTDYTRLYHFAVPATACLTGALWALLRSDGLRKRGWAVATGVLVALTLLARTMTIAYLPGLAAAATLVTLAGRADRRLRMRNLGLATVAMVVVAGPWYIRNARSVGDNLLGAGYGENAARYGPRYPIASWGFWTKELRLVLNYTWLPLAAALALCFLVALASVLVRRERRSGSTLARYAGHRVGIAALALVVVEGYL
ncbi:MAG: glycosyltransferase family 39 protein, partial [Actinomycetota bacterium]|nr:glycosyltransferase family 39 protein [Actinomycetota bacterium]